jgi:phosphate-selective porin OprO/OprP
VAGRSRDAAVWDIALKTSSFAVLMGAAPAVLLFWHSPALAQSAATAAKIRDLEQKVGALSAEIEDLKQSQDAQIHDLKRSQAAQYAEARRAQAPAKNAVKVSMKAGRPTVATANGDFSLSPYALVQFDSAYYGQGRTKAGTDFSSGTNFRRARLGIEGTLFRDWSYAFIYDFGGSGTEASTISSAFLQYNGLAPIHIRAGAYPPPQSFEDSESAGDLLFLERAQPVDAARSIAGSDGREGAMAYAYGDPYFVSAAYTGKTAGTSGFYDAQQAVVARAAVRPFWGPDWSVALGPDVTYVFKLADSNPGNDSPHAFSISERPELNVDDTNTKLITTGTLDADKVTQWGVEAAGNYRSLYAQGGYFGYDISLNDSTLPDPSFDGYYVQASWVLTGEAKPWKVASGAYGIPAPVHPFSLSEGSWGAFELAARFSDLDLNFDEGAAKAKTPLGGIRGGDQKIETVGLNWYLNSEIRFLLDYQHTDVNRLSSSGGNANGNLDAVSLRLQLAL